MKSLLKRTLFKNAFNKCNQFKFCSQKEYQDKIRQQYTSQNHTLMKDTYIYKYQDHYCGFLIIDKKTQSMVCVDPGDSKIALYNIEKLEHEKQVKLTHVLQTHHHGIHNDSSQIIKKYKPDVEIICGNYGKKKNYHTKTIEELKPFSVGDLCICFLHTPGHTDDSCSIAITQVSEFSTKLPFLFTGDTLLAGSVGRVHEGDFKGLNDSLFKIKAFPNETFLFPSHDATMKNYLFCKTLDPKNEILEIKIDVCKQAQEQNQYCLPTSLIEEKNYNPYLQINSKKYMDLLEEKDPIKALQKLKKLQDHYF